MAKEQDLFDLFIEERELRQSGQTLLPSYENGLTTVREQTFVDTFDSQVKEGVQSLFERFTLNEQTKEDLKKGGEVLEGIGKGLFEGGIVNPLALIVDEDSKFMQDAKQATEFNPDFDFANFGYEGAKFFGSYLGLGKLMAIGKVGTQVGKLGTFGKEAVRSLGSTFTAYEGTDENLVDAVMAMGADPDNYPMIRKLMTDPNDSDFVGRLKNVLADLPVEALVPTIAVVLKNIKTKAPPEEIEKSLDTLKKESNELLDKFSVGASINPKATAEPITTLDAVKEKNKDLLLLDVSEKNKGITLSGIKVKELNQGQGIGSKALNDLIEYADKKNKIIALTPDTSFGGTSKQRLKRFYKKFGFVENKGKNKNFSFTETMIRNPKGELAQDILKQADETPLQKPISVQPTNTELQISGRFPTAVKPEADPINEMLDIGLNEIKSNKKIFDNNVSVIKDYPNLRVDEIKKSSDETAETYINHAKDNILWLYDKVPEKTRQRSKLWYDGANKLTNDWAKKYNSNNQSVAGVIAALSPQKDWFVNLSLADRTLDILSNKQNFIFDKQMRKKAKEIIPKKFNNILSKISNKKLSDLDTPIKKAIWLRIYDETYNDRSFKQLTPEGDFIDNVKTDKGENASAAWSSFPMIAKAVASYESGGDVKIISKLMGNKHKVRSFYNNIINPNSQIGEVTIDTHAVAAAQLRPLSANSTAVFHNFGTSPELLKRPKDWNAAMKNSSITGVKGIYGLYVDAYRRAAKERGILPREMQSITWEAIRGLYPKTFKQQQNIEAIDNLWYQYRNNKLNLNEVRNEIERKAGGINPPTWE